MYLIDNSPIGLWYFHIELSPSFDLSVLRLISQVYGWKIKNTSINYLGGERVERKIVTKEDEIANDIISMIVSSGMTFKQANDALQVVSLIMQESSMNFRDNADVKEVLETPNRYRTGLEARLNKV